jgi:hypothetical protein
MSDRLFSFISIVDYDSFCKMVCLESSVLIICLLLLFVRRPFFHWIVRGPVSNLRVTYKSAVLIVAVGCLIFMMYDIGSSMGGSYGDRNLYSVTSIGTDQFNDLGPISVVLALLTAFGYSTVLDRWPSQKRPYALFAIVWFWIALITGRGLVQGTGIMALLPFIMLIMMARIRRWQKKRVVIICGIAAIVTATVGSIAGDIIRLNRVNPTFDRSTLIAGVRAYLSNSSVNVGSGFRETLATNAITVFNKFDSFTGGIVLLRGDGVGTGGPLSLLTSFLAVVPRTILPDKPVPGSADGTYVEIPARIAGRLIGMDKYASMTGVAPCAIAIWELGYPNLLLLIIANVGLLMFLNSLLLTESIYLHALALYVIGIPTFIAIFPSPDVVILNMERALLIYALIVLIAPHLSSQYRKMTTPSLRNIA